MATEIGKLGIFRPWMQLSTQSIAASYHRIVARHPGRFLLGLGAGHPEVTQEYKKPIGVVSGAG
ncbi:hypothetical protein [Streptomyces arenae]|uniref:hypothetical protein n=1 Tax=Streptomyces arenae TaxID=29301 RepID=UPI0026597B25|nr:hypothetical protein [Streptomyces arenae]MCG7210100.1 hypothetical protein [Streptomyces arenae]